MSPAKRALIIMIDPGHGGSDPGAVAGKVCESSINLAVARKLQSLLFAEGINAVLTRILDVTRSLAQRVAQEHELRPDLFISLHCNAAVTPGARGLEIWTSPGDTAADPAATAIYLSLARAFPERCLRTDYSDGDPDKEARFKVLTGTLGPAVLLEMGFVSNPEECAWLCDAGTQTHLAMAIAAGILGWRAGIEEA